MKISDILRTIEAQKDSSDALFPLELEHLKKWGRLEKMPIPYGYAHLAGEIKEAYQLTLSSVGCASRTSVNRELTEGNVFQGILFYVDYGQGEPRGSFILNQRHLPFPDQNPISLGL